MKTYFLFFCSCLLAPLFSTAQVNSKFDISGFYTLILDSEQQDAIGRPYTMVEHFMNLNARYRLSRGWRVGVDYLGAIVVGDNQDNPYHTGGIIVDYDVLPNEKINLNFRLGVSIGNLVIRNGEEPIKQTAINRVFGLGLEFYAYKFLWVTVGYYNHSPMTDIENSAGITLPFIGFSLKL